MPTGLTKCDAKSPSGTPARVTMSDYSDPQVTLQAPMVTRRTLLASASVTATLAALGAGDGSSLTAVVGKRPAPTRRNVPMPSQDEEEQ